MSRNWPINPFKKIKKEIGQHPFTMIYTINYFQKLNLSRNWPIIPLKKKREALNVKTFVYEEPSIIHC